MKKLWVWILALLLLGSLTLQAFAAESDSIQGKISSAVQDLSAMGGAPGMALAGGDAFPAGSSGCDWAAHALALGGSTEYFSEYLDALKTHVEKQYAENGILDNVKATEYHRIAITVLALGGDPTACGTKSDGTSIDLIADGTYNYIGEDLGKQGLNGWIWALIALDASGVEIPANARYQRNDMVQAILDAQEPDGGFGLIAGSSDVDITAMALQALSPYMSYKSAEIDHALIWLCSQMNDDCTFTYGDSKSSESISQVILALCSLGIDPEAPSGFTNGETTLLTALDTFYVPGSGYKHAPEDETGNSLATCQALQALLSVKQLQYGSGYVFSYKGSYSPNQNKQPLPGGAGAIADTGVGANKPMNEMILPIAVCVILGATVIVTVVVIIRRGKKHG